jgi:hypothetical protein|tara:strand:+ start:2704 stop:2925 length:222 start_codon:yes stop_codon:yes gene_type:complete
MIKRKGEEIMEKEREWKSFLSCCGYIMDSDLNKFKYHLKYVKKENLLRGLKDRVMYSDSPDKFLLEIKKVERN